MKAAQPHNEGQAAYNVATQPLEERRETGSLPPSALTGPGSMTSFQPVKPEAGREDQEAPQV